MLEVLLAALGFGLAGLDPAGLLIEIGIAIALLVWGVARLRRADAHPRRPNRAGRTGTWALLALAGLFALSGPLDPTLVALIMLAGRADAVLTVALSHLVWIVVSQIVLVALVVAVLWARTRPGGYSSLVSVDRSGGDNG